MSAILMPLGLDPKTTRLAFVWARKREKPRIRVIKLPEGEEFRSEACGIAFRETVQLLAEMKEDGWEPYLYQEEPVMGRGGIGRTIPQVFIGGATLAAAAEMQCRSQLVNNQSWKKRALGAGNINKQEVAVRMKEVWPELYEAANGDEDIIDAGAIFIYGQMKQDLLASLRRRRNRG